MNTWKIITFALIIVLIFEIAIIKNSYYTFGEVRIKKSELNNLVKLSNSERFTLCDIENNKCVNLIKAVS